MSVEEKKYSEQETNNKRKKSADRECCLDCCGDCIPDGCCCHCNCDICDCMDCDCCSCM